MASCASHPASLRAFSKIERAGFALALAADDDVVDILASFTAATFGTCDSSGPLVITTRVKYLRASSRNSGMPG